MCIGPETVISFCVPRAASTSPKMDMSDEPFYCSLYRLTQTNPTDVQNRDREIVGVTKGSNPTHSFYNMIF